MLRETIWQLAHQTHVFADWRGFSDAALPGACPGGLLCWCSRMLMTTGLSDAVWWLPYAVLVLLLGASSYMLIPRRLVAGSVKWRAVAAVSCLVFASLYVLLPVMSVGSYVWDETESSFPIMNPLGTLLAIWLFAAFRSLSFRGSGALAALACILMFIPFGIYPLISLAALVVCSCAACAKERRLKTLSYGALSVLLAFVGFKVECLYVYDDLAPSIALDCSHAFRLRWNPGGDALARQLRMERAVVAQDWNAVLDACGGADDVLMRMETAYRILAQYRLGRLPDDLFKYPINSPHTLATEDQRTMDGYLLFFGYGLLQQARCYAIELVSKHDWRPDYYRVLGDVAMMQGLTAEARRHYSQLARVPFRREFARKRLNCVATGSIPSDVAEVAEMARVLGRQTDAVPGLELFRLDNLAERHVYRRYAMLDGAPVGMMKMHIASRLLDCKVDALVAESRLLDSIYPGHWPVPVQEAVLLHAVRLDAAGRAAYLKGVRPGVVQREVFERMKRFMDDSTKTGASPSREDAKRMWREYAGTYPMYEWMMGM